MDPLGCAHCGDVIGIYEPIRVTPGDGTELGGSRLTLRSELDQPGSIALHERCYRALEEDAGRD
jgi:hypothetical protein